jgi:hypothetical protein
MENPNPDFSDLYRFSIPYHYGFASGYSGDDA